MIPAEDAQESEVIVKRRDLGRLASGIGTIDRSLVWSSVERHGDPAVAERLQRLR